MAIVRTYVMEEEVLEMLDKIKKEKGVTHSWLVNTAIKHYIKENKI